MSTHKLRVSTQELLMAHELLTSDHEAHFRELVTIWVWLSKHCKTSPKSYIGRSVLGHVSRGGSAAKVLILYRMLQKNTIYPICCVHFNMYLNTTKWHFGWMVLTRSAHEQLMSVPKMRRNHDRSVTWELGVKSRINELHMGSSWALLHHSWASGDHSCSTCKLLMSYLLMSGSWVAHGLLQCVVQNMYLIQPHTYINKWINKKYIIYIYIIYIYISYTHIHVICMYDVIYIYISI